MGRAMDDRKSRPSSQKEWDYRIIEYEGGAGTGGTFDILHEALAKHYWADDNGV